MQNVANDPDGVSAKALDTPGPVAHGDALAHDESVSTGSKYFRDAYEKVPSIGLGHRWYDFPYRFLWWLSSSWRRGLFPRSVLKVFNYGVNYLIPFNEHDRHKIWSLDDPEHNLTIPDDEHVNVPGIWVVELFPPTEFATLEKTIEANSWDKRRHFIHDGKTNKEMLARSRAGAGWTWWRLAEITNLNSTYWIPDGVKEKLPTDFEAVELRAIQIGAGLTAVIAHFHLTSPAAMKLDETWHTRHEPQLVRGAGRPKAESREWATYRLTQTSRRSLHDAARRWMAYRCPGFFAANSEPQLVMDMLLMDKFDPLMEGRPERQFDDALRALGITGQEVVHRTSPDIPKMLLLPVEGSLAPALEPRRTWTLLGQRDAIAAAHEHLKYYGSEQNHAIAQLVGERMHNFLVILAVSDFLSVMEAQYATLRDRARTYHGTFKANGLRQLRESFLTLSLDLTSVARDVDAFRRRGWRQEGDAQFTLDYAPHIVSQDKADGWTRFKPIDMNKDLQEQQRKWFKRLIAADRDYRDILSTVASLGASASAFKIGRMALLIAAASFTVAVATLLVADVGDRSAMNQLIAWVTSKLGH